MLEAGAGTVPLSLLRTIGVSKFHRLCLPFAQGTVSDASVIDSCPMDCARKIFDKCGVKNDTQVKVTDLGIEKVKGVRCTQEQVEKVIDKANEVLAKV